MYDYLAKQLYYKWSCPLVETQNCRRYVGLSQNRSMINQVHVLVYLALFSPVHLLDFMVNYVKLCR